LHAIQEEATLRGYRFDATKIISYRRAAPIVVTCGQLEYEWGHLIAKLHVRDPSWLERFISLTLPQSHPLFQIVPGPVADWEVTRTLRDEAAQRQ